ncbi:MAG: hypothetical protein ABSG25_16095, partial [Bryobacteraceae bacterium]
RHDEAGQFETVALFDRSLVLKEVLDYFNTQRQRIRVMVPADLDREDQKRVKEAAIELLGQ